MAEVYVELKRAFGKPFVFATIGVLMCVLFGAFTDVLDILQQEPSIVQLFAHQRIMIDAMADMPLLFSTPILAAIPFSNAFVSDVKSGYLKHYLPRTTVNRYVLSKMVSCALSGFVTTIIGIIFGYICIILFVTPAEAFPGIPVESRLPELLGKTGLYGLAGALWAMVGMLCSTITMNSYMAYASPFILYYVLVILQERYARDYFMLNPQNYLTLEGKWPFGGWSAAITMLVLLIAVMLGFYIVAQNHLRDDNLKKQRLYLPRKKVVLDKPFYPASKHAVMNEIRQILSVVKYNFRMWRSNARIGLTFALAFILCFLLSDKAATFAYEMETTMQAFEPFVWTFGDANSVLLISLLLILLFVDMPFLGAGVPYYLIRMKRRTWLAGQTVYAVLATILYILFIFAATSFICMGNSFIGNMWSETAAILGYSGAGKAVALPALVKTLEMSRPYQCASTILLLMLFYSLFMVFLMLYLNIKHGRVAGIVGAFAINLFGFLLNPQLFKQLFSLPDELMYKANVAVGWLSPLNHATYHMHNFGYDLLPRLWHTYVIFAFVIIALYLLTLRNMKKYNFHFTGIDE